MGISPRFGEQQPCVTLLVYWSRKNGYMLSFTILTVKLNEKNKLSGREGGTLLVVAGTFCTSSWYDACI